MKEMFRINGLPNDTTMILFRNYPPGSAVFMYFIGKVVGYSESIMLMAQGFLLISNIIVLQVFANWRNPVQIFLSFLAGISLLFVIEGHIYNLLVDTLLGVTALSITIIAYYYKNDWVRNVLTNTPILILLLLIKDSGKLFFIINVAIIIWIIYSYEIKGKVTKSKKRTIILISLLAVLIFPLFTNFLWGQYTETAYPNESYEENKFAITPDRLLTIDKSEEVIRELGPNLLKQATDPTNNNVISMLLLNGLLLLFMIRTYRKTKETPKLLMSVWIIMNIFYVLYIFTLYLMYLFLMPENEAARLAGFSRYHSTVVIYIIGVFMTAIILHWSKANFTLKNAVLKTTATLCLGFIFIYPFHENINTLLSRPDVTNSLRLDVKTKFNTIKMAGAKQPTVTYYSPNSKDDRGYLRYVLSYEQLSNNYYIFRSLDTNEKQESFVRHLNKSHYLVVVDSDKDINKFLGNYVSTDDVEGVYKVIPRKEDFTLKTIK
ncbi:hypothetical protein V7138_13035 [Bacillus sp. JJ1533]|uniref:hypothetical protein n=1 Tax=Bacillus sp. JJ1533 TaxID=3122959 RepID=UPI002FFE06CF